MTPLDILALISAAQAVLKVVIPEAKSLLNKGEISAEDQQKLKDAIDSIRDGSAFQGPEWEQSGTTPK